MLETFKSANNLNQGKWENYCNQKDDERNSLIEHFKETQKDLKVMLRKISYIKHVMESDKVLKVSMK